MLYRVPMRALAAAADGTVAVVRTEKPERWSPPSPAVSYSIHAPHQYTAETAGSKAHLK